ncbi:MAG: hypothetical protein K6E84_04170 [Lachnospiraceae bacterium]|nr:hypothetical protein [Lachnospiraceae bacterium]
MKDQFVLQKGSPYPMGVTPAAGGYNVAVALDYLPKKECGILLYDSRRKPLKVAFTEKCRIGNIYAALLTGDFSQYRYYLFYCDDKTFMDPYAEGVDGRNVWGKLRGEDKPLRATIPSGEEFDWGSDRCPETDFADTIIYGLHVRGFTRHASSKVDKQRRGTFEGVEDKIPYLKSLGITTVECMPIYEFDEIILNPAYEATEKKAELYGGSENGNWQYRINYWGFGDRGNYFFAPKAAYSAIGDPALSLKRLICSLHKAGIEIIMQIYFPLRCDPCYIQRVIHHWVIKYHVDGFHLVGMKIPRSLLALDPLLARTKLIMEEPDGERIFGEGRRVPLFRNLASYKDDFRCDARKYLKGDEDMLRPMAEHMRRNPSMEAVVHHIADYRGFTLMDLVSFDQKHNGPNGENNRDGSEYNYSWNCGVEGISRKKSIQQMRLSQRKNALGFLFLSQGVPFLQAGDEFGHSASGNNNPYCQDNEINWLSWRWDKMGERLLAYTKELIAFRRSHPVLHRKESMRIMDTISCGYPDLSYHGKNAWYAQMENYNRHLGIMLCGLYESLPGGRTDDFIYIAMNMHWIQHDFALPDLPQGYEWRLVCDTKDAGSDEEPAGFLPSGSPLKDDGKDVDAASQKDKDASLRSIRVRPRSMMILVGTMPKALTGEKRKQKNGKGVGTL